MAMSLMIRPDTINAIDDTSATDTAETNNSVADGAWHTLRTIIFSPVSGIANQVLRLKVTAEIKAGGIGETIHWRTTGGLGTTAEKTEDGTSYVEKTDTVTLDGTNFVAGATYTINFQLLNAAEQNVGTMKNLKVELFYLDKTSTVTDSDQWGSWS